MNVAEADFSVTDMAMDVGMDRFNRFKGDDRLYVVFYLHPIRDDVASAAEGRPIYKEVEWVKIMVPGDKGNVINRPANGEDLQRFRTTYDKFKTNSQESLTGTPLEKWPRVTRAQVEELKHFGIRTVEQLSNLQDVHASKFMGIGVMRQWARDFLEAAKAEAPLSAMRAELDTRDAEIAALKDALADQAARLEALEA